MNDWMNDWMNEWMTEWTIISLKLRINWWINNQRLGGYIWL